MTLDQLSAAATEGECPCCGAPCKVTTTPARDFEWKDEYGNYQRTHHHATSSYAYRTGQLVAVADDAIERVEVERLREALRQCRSAVSHGSEEPRRNVREIVDEALAAKGTGDE